MCIGAIIHEHELSSSILLIEIVNHVKLIEFFSHKGKDNEISVLTCYWILFGLKSGI
jgi:hypothetical protein